MMEQSANLNLQWNRSRFQENMHCHLYFITERAVFKLTERGVTLIEIAPGVDLEKDILQHMEFTPYISENLHQMDDRLFAPEPMGLELMGS